MELFSGSAVQLQERFPVLIKWIIPSTNTSLSLPLCEFFYFSHSYFSSPHQLMNMHYKGTWTHTMRLKWNWNEYSNSNRTRDEFPCKFTVFVPSFFTASFLHELSSPPGSHHSTISRQRSNSFTAVTPIDLFIELERSFKILPQKLILAILRGFFHFILTRHNVRVVEVVG